MRAFAFRHGYRAVRADRNAGTTARTQGHPVAQIRCESPALGIAAPPAAQGTAFQENEGADSGSIVNGVSLYVKDKA